MRIFLYGIEVIFHEKKPEDSYFRTLIVSVLGRPLFFPLTLAASYPALVRLNARYSSLRPSSAPEPRSSKL
jgi:hypothetical protein